MELDNIYNVDCYKAIKELPDKFIDLVIIDPPYVVQPRGGGFHSKSDYMDVIYQGGMTKGFSNELLQQIIRVMKKVNLYIFCSNSQLLQILDFFKGYYTALLVWHKMNPIPTINNKYLSDLEYIVFIREKGVKMFNSYETSSMLFQTMVNKKDAASYNHPTIKPLYIIETLIMNSSKVDDVILDCFMGSGTTAVACKNTNRHFIGFEINPVYYDIAQNRIKGITQIDLMEKQRGIQTIFDFI